MAQWACTRSDLVARWFQCNHSQRNPVLSGGEDLSTGERWFSKYGPWTSGSSITWDLARNADTPLYPDIHSRNWGRHGFCSVTSSCLTLCNPMDCSTPGFPVLQHLSKLAQSYIHWVADAIQPSYPLLPPSPPALNLSQHQGLFQWISSSHQGAKASVLASVLPKNIQGWFPLGLTGLISLQSSGFKILLQHHNLKASICVFSTSSGGLPSLESLSSKEKKLQEKFSFFTLILHLYPSLFSS